MDEQGELSCSEVDYMKDIEEIHFGSTSDEEEDDDEPRLRIDTSDDDDSALDEVSNCDSASSTNGKIMPSNPLQSLQQLVHSPFLNAQISAADGGNQGCKFTPIVNDRSKSIVNLDAKSIEMIRSCAINFDAKPSSVSRPMGKSRKMGASKRMNFQRLSPVSIEVVPSLPHLLPPQMSPPLSPKKSDMNSRLNYVVNKLRTSATEEQHLRHLLKLQQQSSPEAEDFKMFQQFLKSGQFQARCNSNNLEVLPASGPNLINLMNKGFRYNSINAQTRSTFGPYMPPMPQLKFKDFNASRMPPTLTAIPKNNGCVTFKKQTNCRRSPPPMVPIESIANFRKPLNEDNVVFRLKKLGTDIEIERSTRHGDDFLMPPISVERVLTKGSSSSSSSVTSNSSDKASFPFFKPIPEDRVVVTKIHPPPPSLIPIQPMNIFLPTQMRQAQTEITVLPVPKSRKKGVLQVTLKKKKKNRLTAKSEYTRLAHALVQAATPLNAPKPAVVEPIKVPIFSEIRSDDNEQLRISVESEPSSLNEISNDTSSKVEEKFDETANTVEPAKGEGYVDENKHFIFHPSQAIQVGVLPNGRKMLSCDICSGVYHKMYSLKKHYYRSHINPMFISEKYASMFKVLPATDVLISDPKCRTAVYWCSICECLFDEKIDLSSHLTDHPPLALENANKNSRLYLCEICNMVFPKKRTQVRHSKKCANEMLKRKAENPQPIENPVEENSNESAKTDEVESEEVPKNGKLETSMMCLFCELSFTDTTKRKKHVLQHHHPKRKHQPCVYCKNKTFSDLSDLLKHICEMHSKRYFGCAICKIRFRTKEDLLAHNAESHDAEQAENEKETDEKAKSSVVANKNGKNFKCNKCTKVFSNTVEMGRHKKSAHRDTSRNNIKRVVSAFSVANDNEQKYRSTIITTADYETEFYKNVCNNVKFNLENCMEGRLEMKKCDYEDSGIPCEFADLPIDKEKEPVPLSFQEMYGTDDIDSRFIHNVSRLHLGTQLTMLRKANLLDKELDCPLHSSVSDRNSTIASRLALAEKPDGADDEAKMEADANRTVFSGEWIRARNYICGTCFARFNNFWDMEDHRWTRHPNVRGFYYEFVTEQAPGTNWAMKRTFQSNGILGVQATNPIPASSTCTKCQKVVTPMTEFHKHILECGGDTTWTSMMFAAHTKRNKKWRPYAGRRRKNIARHRGLKRNIPTTPVKIIGPPRNRQKAGDTETIQRMIANLPPKRITRRVITFDDIDVKSKNRFNNAQQTSSILTRKRKESMDTRSNASSSSSRAQQDSSKQCATSQTLIGTKNNTPYNKIHHRSRISESSVKASRALVESNKEIETVKAIEAEKAIEIDKTIETVPEIKIEPDSPLAEETLNSEISEPEQSCVPEFDTTISNASEVNSKQASPEPSPPCEAEVHVEPETVSDEPQCDISTQETQAEPDLEPNTILVKEKSESEPASEVKETTKILPLIEPKPSEETVTITRTTRKSKASSNKTQPEKIPEPVTPEVSTEPQMQPEPKESSCEELKLKETPIDEPKPKEEKKTSAIKTGKLIIIRSDKKKKKKCSPVTLRRTGGNAAKKSNRKNTVIEAKAEIKDKPVITKTSVEPVVEKAQVGIETPIVEKMAEKLIEPEEGEIDLESAIEPADEYTPALPDTSAIIAAMKETMRQTDPVISNMPIAVTPSKKRKRDDTCKCKKTNTNELPAKKPKPVEIQPKEDTMCEICHLRIPYKSPNEEVCEKCLIPKKPSKKSAQKLKETRPIPPPFRCRKCDTICVAPADGSLFCDKCSRLQETQCLLCKSNYISDTNDKVCGKCMLAGSSKQKKRNIDNEATPAVAATAIPNVENSDAESTKKKCCKACKKETEGKCTCKKRKTSIQSVTEIMCDNCGIMWKDEDNSGSPICRNCRQTNESNSKSSKSDSAKSSEEDESSKCVDCNSIPTNEVTLKKLCDGCSSRKNERKLSNESRPECSNTKAAGVQVSTTASALVEEVPKVEPAKEEPSPSDHKTPMKNVKLICRGCYGVFDTVSSYKFHCDHCKHRTNEIKPLLSFAKRNSKGNPEIVTQPEPSTSGASFEILEGVQIKYVEMSNNASADKTESGKETPSQIPLVVYEGDSTPIKKSDASRTPKKQKRTHSSPETIMDTIESVIKSVCYNSPDPVSNDEEPPKVEAAEEPSKEPLEKVRDILESNLESEETPEESKGKVTELQFDTVTEPKKRKNTRTKANPKSRKRGTKKAKKAASPVNEEIAEMETEQSSVTVTPQEENIKEDVSVSETSVVDDEKSSKKTPSRRILPSNDPEALKKAIISSRLRTRPKNDFALPRRALRSNVVKISECSDDSKNMETDETEPQVEPIKDDAVEDVQKVIPKSKKRKNESPKSDAKKSKTDTSNDLGFAVTKVNKTVPKNVSKKKSTEPKNDTTDEVETQQTEAPSRKASDVIEPPLEGMARRKSSEHSEASVAESTSNAPKEDSRRNSTVTDTSMESRNFQNELNTNSFFGHRSPQSVNDADFRGNEISTFNYDDQSNLSESYDGQESATPTSNAWAWDFLDQKSLGSILDTVNEILSRPEVSSCSSDSVDSFREEMMMFQHFGREMSAIEKQEEECMKQDEETTTIMDLDELSKSDPNKIKETFNEAPSEAGSTCSSSFNEECDMCDQIFTDSTTLHSHMSNIHGNDANKNLKDIKSKQPNKVNQNGMKIMKHRCNHCQKVLQSKADMLMHMKEHWKSFTLSKSDSHGSHLKNSIADKLEELLLDKALVNYLKSPQETQHRNNLPLKILNQISLAKKNQFTNWKSALAQVLDMDPNIPSTSAPTAPVSTPPVEPTVSVPEPATTENAKSQNNESATEPVEGYPCPMCNKTFQFTRTRNTHLIMVHAPRQSTHKHLIEGSIDTKKDDKNKPSNENNDSIPNEAAREKIFHSYLLNESVNTVLKKEPSDEASVPKISTSTSTSLTEISKKDKIAIVPKTEPSGLTASTTAPKSKPTVAPKPSSEDDRSKKKKPCRKKMSKKEMNLPAAIVKLKAEQALLQLCNSRFNRICSQ